MILSDGGIVPYVISWFAPDDARGHYILTDRLWGRYIQMREFTLSRGIRMIHSSTDLWFQSWIPIDGTDMNPYRDLKGMVGERAFLKRPVDQKSTGFGSGRIDNQ